MLYLLPIDLKPGATERNGFPFTLPLGALRLTSDVTFFVSENGSGKSTLLEAVAASVISKVIAQTL